MEYTSVTLYHNAGFDPQTHEDKWTRGVHMRALWHGTQAAKMMQADSGLTDASAYTVRIFTQDTLAIAPDDLLVLGECAAQSVADVPPSAQTCRVSAVTDARRGSAQVRHWKVVGV